MKGPFEAVDLNRIKTVSLGKRKSLVSLKRMARVNSGTGARRFFDHLPDYLKATDFKSLIRAILAARQKNKPVILMTGGHLIKVGLSPIIIDLIRDGLISGLCLNGSGLIHDSEIAMVGRTSEDVTAGIADGSFGMARETSEFFAEVVALAAAKNMGLGQAAGMALSQSKFRHRNYSLLAACYRQGIPATVHLAVDTDIVCQHPNYDAAAAAKASHHDFKILVTEISNSENGGVFINVGSAVILPEVFLKALTVARNIYKRPYRIVTANFDMISHYRPLTNVVQRPTLKGGRGFNFIGHHEIMIPLLAWGIKGMMVKKRQRQSG